jgi:hypothetical protein
MTVIVPDDEEFANRRKRNRCEYYRKRCSSWFPWSFFVVVYCDGMKRIKEILLKKRNKNTQKRKEKRDCPPLKKIYPNN